MMVRSFIAVEIPANIQQAIAVSAAALQKALPKPVIRWVPSQNIHLTLKFLGDVSPANLQRLADALLVEASAHPEFDMRVEGAGAFPSSRRARVLWIGLKVPASLAALHRGVEAVTTRMGFPAENRPFSPHLTFGRVRQDVSAADLLSIHSALEKVDVGDLGSCHVKAVHIFKSDLNPSGSIYTCLYTLPLAGNN